VIETATGALSGPVGPGQQGDMATVTELGQAGLQGWREKVANGISQPVANRAPLEEDQVRAVVGAAFFVLSVMYIAKTISAATRQARRG
jgi:hypothetical protein